MENLVFADLIVKRFVDRTAQAIPVGPRTAHRKQAASAGDARPYRRGQSGRVVLFLPGPVTEDDLFTDAIAHARGVRRHKARRRYIRWLEDNCGTVVFVAGLFVLAWLVSAK